MLQIGKVHLRSAVVEHVNQLVADHRRRHLLGVDAVLADDNLVLQGVVAARHLLGAVLADDVPAEVQFAG